MAKKVTAMVTGGKEQVLDDVSTVRDVLNRLNLSDKHTATINGDPADLSDDVEDYNYVAFSEKVKGGR